MSYSACKGKPGAEAVTRATTTLLVHEAAEAWQKITPAQRQELESRYSLNDLPAADVSSEPAIIASLDIHDLGRWNMLIEAIPQRFANALQEAARLLEPRAVTVRLPGGTLHNEAEIEAWLKKAEATLKEKLKQGPVILA